LSYLPVAPNKKHPNSSKSWRIWSHPNDLVVKGGWAWDVAEIEFYSDVDCSKGNKVPNNLGKPIESGNAGRGWGASNAFGGRLSWGGRPDNDGMFWIGMKYDKPASVKCVRVKNVDWHDKSTNEFQIHALNESGESWDIVTTATDLDTSHKAWNKISIKPTEKYPTVAPSNSPVASPISYPLSHSTSLARKRENFRFTLN